MAGRGSVTSGIARYIHRNIQSGAWAVGCKIPSENQLCRELGVSRVSVRSALQQFMALGILESARGKGTFVISDDLSLFALQQSSEPCSRETLESMKHILEFRCLIEPAIAAMAAENAAPGLIARLEEQLETMRSSVGESARFVAADVQFHLELCRAGNNPVTISVMEDILLKRTDLGYALNLALGYYGGMYYHTLLLDAIKNHDGKQARSLMLEHLQRGIYDLRADNSAPEPAAEA